MKADQAISEQYLVPFGREPGGLLDFLGLPPNATDGQIGDKKREYQNNLTSALRQRNVQLNEEKAAGRISPEEFDAQLARAEEEKSKARSKLLELNRAYVMRGAQRRKLGKSGEQEDDSAWTKMYGALNAESLWDELLQRRPLPKVSPDWLAQLYRRWFSGSEGQETPDLPSSRCPTSGRASLSLVLDLVAERDTLHLMACDLLWQEIDWTNRLLWSRRIADWVKELEALGPRLRLQAETEADGTEEWAFPGLCQLKTGMVDRLEVGQVQDFGQGPRRAKAEPEEVDVRRLMELLAKAAAKKDVVDRRGRPEGVPATFAEVLRLMAGLTRDNELLEPEEGTNDEE